MKEKSNLTLFMEQLIRSLKEEERFSTAHIYQSTLNASCSSARPMHPVQPDGTFTPETI